MNAVEEEVREHKKRVHDEQMKEMMMSLQKLKKVSTVGWWMLTVVAGLIGFSILLTIVEKIIGLALVFRDCTCG